MAKEIERKFIVDGDAWRDAVEASKTIVQAYLAVDGETSVRVRITDGNQARLTVKVGASAMTRDEFEYPIPLDDAQAMMNESRGRMIEKTRHIIPAGPFVWEVDVFGGALAGLVIAEVEMRSEDDDPALPSWLGREVTGDRTFSNAVLAIEGMGKEPGR
ncbi:CYTH domain-containing protein [Hoeflea sp. AS60]|uniref:CYTH domain-containing protein n=1 Tax=Hoeflea sp. AS60 TaxID=3135780 RepID=UPI0031828BCA